MDSYNKKIIKDILDSKIVIHWWNHGSKTLYFDGTTREYLKKENVKIRTKAVKVEESSIDRITVKAKFSVGGLTDIQFSSRNIEDVVRMVVNVQLSYLGDKSQYVFNHRRRTINF